ncbi:type II CRISPR-associated endonuclease Cas1 [Mollicutes bacterium LVI A0039]|nr:type II CRISPR-associated endonuclease Cas1 [Mollicutes bacterium LVI A0039]
MSFRQIIVSESKYINVEHSQLNFQNGDSTVRVPIEDVAIIIIDNTELTITVNAINSCMDEHIMIVVCNNKHLPNGIIMPFGGHYRQLEMTYKQLSLKTVKKQNLWREIIIQKIHNQSRVSLLCEQEATYEYLMNITKQVERNDKTNREAVAAKKFFGTLYGTQFKRFVDDKINSCLNYGYSILVSAISRELVSYGLDPKFGIWHSSKSNALNLSYDLVEPFRPVIDYYVSQNLEFITEELSPHNKRGLVSLLNARVKVGEEKMRLQNAIEKYCAQFMKIVDGTEQELLEVEIIKINFYEI